MKWLCLAVLLLPMWAMAWPTTNRTFTVDLAWDASPADEGVTGYVVYVSTNSFYGPQRGLPLLTQVEVTGRTNLTATVTNLMPGQRYYFVVTAHDDLGMESDFSNEVFWDAPKVPGAPRLRLVVQVVLESAPTLQGPWKVAAVYPEHLVALNEGPAQFYRARLESSLWR